MWTKAAVDEALKTYIADRARAAHIAAEADELEKRVGIAVHNLAADEASPKAQVITDMPHGTGVTNPTEQVVLKVVSGWEPADVKEMRRELEALRVEYRMLTARIRFVDAWLSALTERESWIMRHQVMQHEFWRDVLDDYAKQFGGYATKETLKRLRAAGLRKIYQTAGIKN